MRRGRGRVDQVGELIGAGNSLSERAINPAIHPAIRLDAALVFRDPRFRDCFGGKAAYLRGVGVRDFDAERATGQRDHLIPGIGMRMCSCHEHYMVVGEHRRH